MRSDIQHEDKAGPSSWASAGESSRKESAKVPKDPMEDFTVSPAGTPFGEGFFAPSGFFPWSFPWIPNLGPMLAEIWGEESFKRLSEAVNREGMRMLTGLALLTLFSSGIPMVTFNSIIYCRHSSPILSTPGEPKPSSTKVEKPCFTFVKRTKNRPPSSTRPSLKWISQPK